MGYWVMRRVFLFWPLLVFFSCTQQGPHHHIREKLQLEEQDTLDFLFRHFLEHTSLGYVLFGDKPVFTWGTLSGHESVGMLGDSLHQESVSLKKGLKILKALPINQASSEFLLLESPGFYEGWNELWVIHKKNFEKVFNENQPLFQYILGPNVSAQTLLEELMRPHASLSTLLRGDRVLMGIVLGYGTENALVVSRHEYLEEYIQDQSIPLKLTKTVQDFGRGFYRSIHDEPSFSYPNIQEECNELGKKTRVTVDIYPQTRLPQLPHFGFLQAAPSEALIKKYQRTHEVIRKQLESPHLLETILSKLIGQEGDISPAGQTIDMSKGGYTIGQAIWQSLFEGEENGEEVDAFLKGMKARETEAEIPVNDSEYRRLFETFNKTQKSHHACKNLEFANHFFEELAKKGESIIQLGEGIYREILWEGEGLDVISQNSEVTLTISVKNLKGQCLFHKLSANYQLAEIDQALSYALLGMKEGEERRIYFHPEAVESIDLTQNGGFIVTVCLEKILHQQKASPTLPTQKNFSSLLKNKGEIEQKYQDAKNALYFAKGVGAWHHYMKLPNDYSLQEVLHGFNSAQQGELVDTISPPSEDFLTEVHWKIYSQ
jgi:hypothetical protein